MKFALRFVLLAIGFALTSAGLLAWEANAFSFAGLWGVDGTFRVHPLHLLVLGIALIPPTLWEIFLLVARDDT